MQHKLQQPDQLLAVSVEESIIARASETLGQHMLQQQPEKIGARQCSGFRRALVVGIAEGYLTIAHGDDVVLAQYATIEVFAKIGDGLVATADTFAVDHPLFGQSGCYGQSVVLERLQPLGAKDPGQTVVAEQILATLPAPEPVLRIQRAGRHDPMNMRVIVQLAGMRMQHGGRADPALERLVPQPETSQRFPTELEQQIEGDPEVSPGQASQLAGMEMKVPHFSIFDLKSLVVYTEKCKLRLYQDLGSCLRFMMMHEMHRMPLGGNRVGEVRNPLRTVRAVVRLNAESMGFAVLNRILRGVDIDWSVLPAHCVYGNMCND